MKKMMLLAGLTTVAMNAGCAWVELEPSAQRVSLLSLEQGYNCKKLGTTTSIGKNKIWVFDRSDEKVAEELTTMARNRAADMGGNAISPVNQSLDGKQTFNVLSCPNGR